MRSHDGAAELISDIGYYGITETAYLSHPAGNPMSQQIHSGFNPPAFPIRSEEPLGIAPCAA